MTALVIKAPQSIEQLTVPSRLPSVFLAGSIDQNTAINWQGEVEQLLAKEDVILLNPRREVWDPSLRQAAGEPEFRRQVFWELEAQERCSHILMYFAPGGKSPISLLETGLFAPLGKMTVCCPHGFWKRASVSVICEYLGIPLHERLEDAVSDTHHRALSKEYCPSAPVPFARITPSVLYIGGSVDGGKVPDWQSGLQRDLADASVLTVNPRRSDWNPSWAENEGSREFHSHVLWQLRSQQSADHVFLYFKAGSTAALALFELGFNAHSGKLTVCCEDGFWRKGNVELVCERYQVPFYHKYEYAVAALKREFAL